MKEQDYPLNNWVNFFKMKNSFNSFLIRTKKLIYLNTLKYSLEKKSTLWVNSNQLRKYNTKFLRGLFQKSFDRFILSLSFSVFQIYKAQSWTKNYFYIKSCSNFSSFGASLPLIFLGGNQRIWDGNEMEFGNLLHGDGVDGLEWLGFCLFDRSWWDCSLF